MNVGAGILFLFVLAAAWDSDARPLTAANLSEIVQLDDLRHRSYLPEVLKNDNVCTFCEEFTAEALKYLASNKTQAEIINMLHHSCSRIPHLKQECITLVDYYAPLFFSSVSLLQPDEFCEKVDLCKGRSIISSPIGENSCNMCHQTVSEILTKLSDPETQLEIIQLLVKGCSSMEHYAKKCKLIILKYGPLILSSAKEYLETNDLCTMLRVCGNEEQVSTVHITDT